MNGVRLGLLALVAAMPTWACTFGCVEHVDVRSQFTIETRFEGKPLAGTQIKITGQSVRSGAEGPSWRFTTGADGKALIEHLSDGEYYMTAYKLGIIVGSECSLRVSGKHGKRELHYTLNEKPWPVTTMSGRLTEWQWESRMNRIIHKGAKKEVAAKDMQLTLHAFVGVDRKATVSDDGSFDFGTLPEGLYVLQSDADNVLPRLFRLDANAEHRDLNLMWVDVICGGKAFFFRDEVKE